MNVTEKEIKKFIGLFYREDYERVCDFLSSKKIFEIWAVMTANQYGDYIGVDEACGIDSSGHYDMSHLTTKQIRLNSCSDRDIDFVLSFISRYFENFKLIFSSSLEHVFVATTENMQVSLHDGGCIELKDKTLKFLAGDLLSQNRFFATIGFSKYNCDVSDELWNIILNDHRNVTCMLSAYLSGKYLFSEKIKNRINALYESLSDSDKLLFELGGNPGDEEDGLI